VPALQLDDGSILTENVALLMYLGDKAGLTHQGIKRYRLLEWLAFITSEIHKSFSPLFQQSPEDAVVAAKAKIVKRLKFVEERFAGDYVMGNEFCPADAYLYVMLRWCDTMKLDTGSLSKLTAFKARMVKRSGVSAALAAEGIS
jgi:glutathione S-transferase